MWRYDIVLQYAWRLLCNIALIMTYNITRVAIICYVFNSLLASHMTDGIFDSSYDTNLEIVCDLIVAYLTSASLSRPHRYGIRVKALVEVILLW